MKYYRVITIFALISSLLIPACGTNRIQGYDLAASLGALTPEQSPFVTTLGVSGLKPQLHFTYSLSGHPNTGGFTIVALENEYTPKQPAEDHYSISIAQENNPAEPDVVLSTSGQRSVLAHLRYDPAKWEVGGVSSSNCWPGAEDFLAMAIIVEPGVLLLSNKPVESAPATGSTAVFATVRMQPVGKRISNYTDTISGDVDSSDHYFDQPLKVIWLRNYSPPPVPPETEQAPDYSIEGTITYRLDGAFGDPNSKDGDIVSEDSELVESYVNNQLHNLEFSQFGQAYTSGNTWTDLNLSFRETFIADYNNDGIVNIADEAPIGEFWNTGYDYYAQRGAHESGQTEWLNLKKCYLDYIYDPNTSQNSDLWYWTQHNVNAYWYQNHADWTTKPTGFTYTAASENANAVDGNWDGFVYDYNNQNTLLDPFTLENKYDEPNNHKWHPGDLALIQEHWGEQLTGYQIYIQGYSESTPPDFHPDTLRNTELLVRNYYRVEDELNPPEAPALTPTPVPYDNSFGDNVPGKPIVNMSLTQFDFPGINGSSNVNYDIYIYPYYYHINNQTQEYEAFRGPETHLSHAYSYHTEGQPPVFVSPVDACSAALAQLPDSYKISYSLEGAVATYFFPAVDQPAFSGDDQITYTCYSSLRNFTRNEIDGSLPSDIYASFPLTYSYNDNWHTDGFPHFDYDLLEFIIDNDGNPLDDGEMVYFIVLASDASGNTSTNSEVHSDAARQNRPEQGLVLASGLNAVAAGVTGSLQADENNVFAIYPKSYIDDPGINDITTVNYMAIKADDSRVEVDNVLSASPFKIRGSGSAIEGLYLTHTVDNAGNPIVVNGARTPILAYCGVNLAYSPFHLYFESMTSVGSEFSPWGSYNWHSVLMDPSFDCNCGQAITPFTRVISTPLGYQFQTDYALLWAHCGWIVNDDPAHPPLIPPHGSLNCKVSASPLIWGTNYSEVESNVYYDSATAITLRTTNLRKCRELIPGPSISALPNQRLYALCVTQHSNGAGWESSPDIDLHSTGDLTNWSHIDLDSNLPYMPQSAGILRAPSSIDVVVDPLVKDTLVYVAYCNTVANEFTNDSSGLRIAMAHDTGSGPAIFSSPTSAGLIDGAYCRSYEYEDLWTSGSDSLELRVKPNSSVSNQTYKDLGCAYFTANGIVYLSQSIGYGDAATWEAFEISPDPDIPGLEEGEVKWVRLVYYQPSVGPAIPYVLYSIRRSISTGWEIILWRPGGF